MCFQYWEQICGSTVRRERFVLSLFLWHLHFVLAEQNRSAIYGIKYNWGSGCVDLQRLNAICKTLNFQKHRERSVCKKMCVKCLNIFSTAMWLTFLGMGIIGEETNFVRSACVTGISGTPTQRPWSLMWRNGRDKTARFICGKTGFGSLVDD